MENYKKYLAGGILGILLSFALATYLEPLKGLYVLSTNSLILFVWMVLTAHGRGKHQEALRVQAFLVFGFLSSFLVTLLLIGTVYNQWGSVVDLLTIFAAFSLFILILIIFEGIAIHKGKELIYPSESMNVFWSFQWLSNLSLVLKSDAPLKTFLLVLPAIIGGYLIFKGLVRAKLSNRRPE
ncbi:hypothetical protein [Pyrococcus sp. ST04]|uniref:hypothetical protein n=1 Tax=Pyrococcus sp. ST04 TaxID=1183377 RepID=UPI0002605D8C|nr:hypothetical protein [Pyrococcus sp. ST04]AFK22475.1 hypothetical protein Py04_0888 [Pyrococcus sp. ST04]